MFHASYQNTASKAKRFYPDPEETIRLRAKLPAIDSKRRKLAQEREKAEQERKERIEMRMKLDRALERLGNTGLQLIIKRMCRVFKVMPIEVYSSRRDKHVTLCRHAIAYWAVRRTPLSLPQIGRRLGGRDHTTIVNARDSYPKKRAAMGRTLRSVR